MARRDVLVTQGHALELVQETAPVVRQHLGVLDSFPCPVLIPAADVVLRRLESDELVSDTLLDKDRPVMLLDD